MEEVLTMIRSVLVSSKEKSDLRTLQRDYRMITGEDIPYRKHGYSSLELFLRSFPTLSVSHGPNGELYVDAVKTAKVSHLIDLVNRQKSAKKRTKSHARQHYSARHRPSPQSWKPVTKGKKWEMSYKPSARPTTLSHNQIVNWNTNKTPPSSENKSVISKPPTSSSENKTMKPPNQPTLNNKLSKKKVAQSPRSRATILSKQIGNMKVGTVEEEVIPEAPLPSPPILDMEKNFTSRIHRSSSSGGFQSSSGDSSSLNRPRMRTQTSLPFMTSPTSPTSPGPIQFTSPQLSFAQMELLRKEALEAADPNSALWNFPSSGESSPRKYILPSETDAPLPADSWKALTIYAKKHNLGEPLVKILTRRSKSLRITLYDCQIRIGSNSYSSYPEDCHSEEAAKKIAAKIALSELFEKYNKQEPLLLSSQQDVLNRIPPIIQKHFHGVWSTQIEMDYKDEFNEQLPPNWLVLLDTLPTISVEPALDNKMVLRHCKIGEKYKFNNSPAPEVSIPSNTVNITEEGCFVQVTCAISTVEIWCRQLSEEGERYDQMMEDMEEFYKINGEHAISITVGGFYVACIDENWCRVRALQISDQDVLCFFIDYGDENLVPKSNIYVLNRQFAREQAQAFVCRLAGLEELVNMDCSTKHIFRLISKNYIAYLLRSDEEELGFDQSLRIVLYDITENQEININKKLMCDITKDSVNTILDMNKINKVYVTHAEPNGDIYVQIHSEGYEKFHELMEHYNSVDIENEFPETHTPGNLAAEELFLTKWSNDSKYYRCTVLDISPQRDYAQIYFVDFGNTDIIKLKENKLIPLKDISDVVCLYPYQAIKVQIDINGELPVNFVDRVLDIMPIDQLILLKVIKMSSDNIPICEFFKRSETDNVLFSVNGSLQIENEISDEFHDDGNNNHDKTTKLTEKLERLNTFKTLVDHNKPVPSHGLLKAPDLPSLNTYFDVHVSCAVSPWNFFIQPYKSLKLLEETMAKLQEHYNSMFYSPIQIDDVLPGKIYASKYYDGCWYRTSVIKIIHSGSISVFYCDFGYYGNLTVNQLMPLFPEFMELPYQAIKAKMAGIQIKAKWTTSDCNYFQQLVCRKSFVSKIIVIEKDELYKSDMVLGLELIDTSTPKDIHIDKILLEKGIAVAISETQTS